MSIWRGMFLSTEVAGIMLTVQFFIRRERNGY